MNNNRVRNHATSMEDPFSSKPKQAGYNPNHLLETLLVRLQLKSSAALSRALEIDPPLISKIRHGKLAVSAPLLIRMHEVSGLSIKELRALMGDRRKKFRISEKHYKLDEDAAIAMRRH
jgi:plasmid maintenance system antidote protein VapI